MLEVVGVGKCITNPPNRGNCFQQQINVHEQHVHNSSKLQSVQYFVSCNIVSRMHMEQSVTY